jgi:5-methylcytosine-specific restriction endonuclease McrA
MLYEISLSNASQVQSVFRASKAKTGEKISKEEKKEILEKISGMTQRQCQSALLELIPEATPKLMERDRQVSEERFELKLIISKEVHDQIDELKLLLSHSLQLGGTTELLVLLVQQEMKRQEKKREENKREMKLPSELPEEKEKEKGQGKDSSKGPNDRQCSEATAAPVRTEIVRSRKYISIALRREIWKRANGSCEAIDKTGRCTSRYRLELDHIVPHGQGGGDSFENLRLCCRAHNTKHAIESYGEELMSNYR